MPQFFIYKRDISKGKNVLITIVECKECNVAVYSRAHEDVRECECGRIVVSGGQQHFKYNTAPGTAYEIKKTNVHVSIHTLYEDWHSMSDRYGLIKGDPQQSHVQ